MKNSGMQTILNGYMRYRAKLRTELLGDLQKIGKKEVNK